LAIAQDSANGDKERKMTALTLELPDSIYSSLKQRAEQSQRTVEAELLELLANAMPSGNELPADLAEAIAPLAALDDRSLWVAARNRFSLAAADQLQSLHTKRQREGLTERETETLSDLVRQYEKAMLIRAQAAALLRQRGHDVSELAVSA
jgi:plasmid stability protein